MAKVKPFCIFATKTAKIGCISAKHPNTFDALRSVCTIFAAQTARMMAEEVRNSGRGRKKATVQVVPEMGRLQPQARELEEAVLGALLLEKDAYSIVSDILKPESIFEDDCIFDSGKGRKHE